MPFHQPKHEIVRKFHLRRLPKFYVEQFYSRISYYYWNQTNTLGEEQVLISYQKQGCFSSCLPSLL